ncbi:MAG: hypothetical protein ACJAYD_000675, partial [Patiriisocius sp.]
MPAAISSKSCSTLAVKLKSSTEEKCATKKSFTIHPMS